jgi:PadR family transcriptional regulator, regulatory protein PadR
MRQRTAPPVDAAVVQRYFHRKSISSSVMDLPHQKLLSGLIRLHVLHHAAQGPIFGNAMIEELARHGYRLSPGTLYPLLHGLERDGYVSSKQKQADGRVRRFYRATAKGRRALHASRDKIRELFKELVDEHEP